MVALQPTEVLLVMVYISDRRDSTCHRLTKFWLTQPLPALSAVYCTTGPSDRAGGERLGESNLCKTQGGAVPSITDIYSLDGILRRLADFQVYKTGFPEDIISVQPWLLSHGHLRICWVNSKSDMSQDSGPYSALYRVYTIYLNPVTRQIFWWGRLRSETVFNYIEKKCIDKVTFWHFKKLQKTSFHWSFWNAHGAK